MNTSKLILSHSVQSVQCQRRNSDSLYFCAIDFLHFMCIIVDIAAAATADAAAGGSSGRAV